MFIVPIFIDEDRNGFLGEKCLVWHFDVSEFETLLFERDEIWKIDEYSL